MTPTEWAGLIVAATGLVTAVLVPVGRGCGWLIEKLLAQSKETIEAIEADRDEWKERAAVLEEEREGACERCGEWGGRRGW